MVLIEQVKNILPRADQLEVYKVCSMACIKNPDYTEPVDCTFVEFIKNDDDNELRLVNIVIDEDFKGQGIGSRVAAALVNYCKENNLSFVAE